MGTNISGMLLLAGNTVPWHPPTREPSSARTIGTSVRYPLGLERFTDMARTAVEAATFALVVLVFLRCVPRSSSSGSRCGTMPPPCAVAALHANPAGGQVQSLFSKAPAIELASMSTLPAIPA